MLTRIFLLFVLILPIPIVTAETLPRVAIVPGGDPKPEALLALSEAKLFELKGLELLERTEIDKVLAEQQLSGLFDAVSAIELGRILKADLFAVLETTSIVIFDAQTGLRFVDETLPESIEEAAQVVAEAVTTATEKRHQLDQGNLVTFGILEVRNADFPVDRDAWCRAVAGMLERELLRRGGAVLERSRLQLVNRERQLTGDTPNDLLTSMKLINLEFTRGETTQSFQLTVRIGREIYRAESPFDKPLNAVQQIVGQLLDTPRLSLETNNYHSEAARFAWEADILNSLEKPANALEKIEAAVALQPENVGYRRQLWTILVTHTTHRLKWRSDKFEYDDNLKANRIDADTMRQIVQDTLRLEALATTFPKDNGIFGLTQRDFNRAQFDFRQNLTTLTDLANHLHPDFKDEIHSLNRRMQGTQAEENYRNYRSNRNRVVDQNTFQEYIFTLGVFGNMETVDRAALYAEIIEDVLRLSQEYEVEAKGPYEISTMRCLFDFYQRFVQFAWGFRSENLAETNSEAAAMVQRTIALMEKDSRMMPQLYAWIARNRTVNVYRSLVRAERDRDACEVYLEKLKAHLADIPKGMAFYDYSILYHELTQLSREVFGPTLLGEIIELADSRNEVAWEAVYEYIRWVSNSMRMNTDKTEFLKQKQQLDPVVLRQLELAQQLGFEKMVEVLGRSARDAEIGVKLSLTRPWTEEINLQINVFSPGGKKPILRGNMLYCTAWDGTPKKYYLACVNLETLEKRFIPCPNAGLIYVDDVNAYFQKVIFRELHVYPLDGSEPWSLTLEDGLPSDMVFILGTLDGWCYAKLSVSWLIRINLQNRQWELLSSRHAKEGKTPFVNGRAIPQWRTVNVPAQERILLYTERDVSTLLFWAIEKDGTFIDLGYDPDKLRGLLNNNEKLLLENGSSAFIFDCETGNVSPTGIRMYSGCLWNGSLWGGISKSVDWRWGWHPIGTTEEIERLPVPEEMTSSPHFDRSIWVPSFCAPTPDGKGLIVVGDDVILLHFE